MEPTTIPDPTVTFNGKVYLLNTLPKDIQEFVGVHQAWEAELMVQRREVFKLEAALRGLLSELTARFNAVDAAAAALEAPPAA